MSTLTKNHNTEALLGEQLDAFTLVAGVAITAIALVYWSGGWAR